MSEPTEESKTPPISPEEMKKRKLELKNFYKDQIEFLKIQGEYEELQTKMTESRARRARAEMVIAQIYAGPQEEEEDSKEDPSTKGEKAPEINPKGEAPGETVFRKLKTDK